jgi:hypothetical protein
MAAVDGDAKVRRRDQRRLILAHLLSRLLLCDERGIGATHRNSVAADFIDAGVDSFDRTLRVPMWLIRLALAELSMAATSRGHERSPCKRHIRGRGNGQI